MGEEFERELAEDWESAKSDLDSEIIEIQIGVTDAMEFGEED